MTHGLLRGIEEGWFTSEIAEAAFVYQKALEKGDKKVVGVNVHKDSVTSELEILRVSHEVERDQVRELAERRTGRDEAAIAKAIEEMLDRRPRGHQHDPGHAGGRAGPRRRWARSATPCARSGASTGSRPASEPRCGLRPRVVSSSGAVSALSTEQRAVRRARDQARRRSARG